MWWPSVCPAVAVEGWGVWQSTVHPKSTHSSKNHNKPSVYIIAVLLVFLNDLSKNVCSCTFNQQIITTKITLCRIFFSVSAWWKNQKGLPACWSPKWPWAPEVDFQNLSAKIYWSQIRRVKITGTKLLWIKNPKRSVDRNRSRCHPPPSGLHRCPPDTLLRLRLLFRPGGEGGRTFCCCCWKPTWQYSRPDSQMCCLLSWNNRCLSVILGGPGAGRPR